MNQHDQTMGQKLGVIAAAFLLIASTAFIISSEPAAGESQDSPSDTAQITGATKPVKAGTANHIALLTVFNGTTPILECHGVLVSPTYVLGSSGCANVSGATRTLVTLGAVDVTNLKKHDHEFRVATQAVVHPQAGDAQWGSYAYEMALYKLNQASTRRPVLLGSNNLTEANRSGILQGYGPTTTRGNDGGTLRKGTVDFASRSRTVDIMGQLGLPSNAPYTDFILSEGGVSNHVKSCDDPGAPVITNVKGKPTLLAMSSRQYVFQGFGICNDALDEYIHFYFNVTSPTNANWINDVVGKTGPAKDAKCNGRWATIFGTNGADAIFGTSGVDSISGGKGNDILNGGRGKDRLCGGNGVDVLIGGAGKDICNGGQKKDRVKSCEKTKSI